ncbi:hypothetical protein PFICI_00104 [Pestalotiopsis fici W106-1]|uniref:Major facilitator superfamily (MFS) profile domain-containing protein n=1 Tax=Pestalotiopsis fici (strain W106-1 / CGMCC3.15140) TaxID=1229662 RepID=W3XM00_PESFW|nr:uncharacterized protein PFICI_00104 [Pestalotiopsis fici W106-1]ETS86276.1 hypothetical protein PFICI_00104 [Pestalotiopsis fici W106-1]
MDSVAFSGLLHVEPPHSKLPSQPERALSVTHAIQNHEHDLVELASLKPTDPTASGPARRAAGASYTGSPVAEEAAAEVFPSIFSSRKDKLRLAACCSMSFTGGLNDSAAGALIPYMETHYNIGYGTVSLIFVGVAIGFITAAPFVDSLQARFGSARAFGICMMFLIAGYIPIICAVPIPAIVVSFFLVGFGLATSLSMYNVFLANLPSAGTALGMAHGSYGVGGIVGPLIATSMVSNGVSWSMYYLITLGLAIFNLGFAPWTFWTFEQETQTELGPVETSQRGTQQLKAMLQAFRTKVVLLGALFIFAYQGSEVSISGWVISFLITMRNGDPTRVGYVSSGFWAGITLGRFFLSPLAARIGEKRFVYGIVAGATIFELLVWLVPNVIGNAVALAIVGLLLGPVYTGAAVIFTRNLSRKEQASGMAVISAFGSSGGAIAPFTTGILAQAVGTFVLHPIAIGLFAVMMISWFCIPTPRKRTE